MRATPSTRVCARTRPHAGGAVIHAPPWDGQPRPRTHPAERHHERQQPAARHGGAVRALLETERESCALGGEQRERAAGAGKQRGCSSPPLPGSALPSVCACRARLVLLSSRCRTANARELAENQVARSRRARVMSAAHRVAVLATYRRALKIARDWPRLVSDPDKSDENTVAAQQYIRSEARQLIENSAHEQNPHVINKCAAPCSRCAARCSCLRDPASGRLKRPCEGRHMRSPPHRGTLCADERTAVGRHLQDAHDRMDIAVHYKIPYPRHHHFKGANQKGAGSRTHARTHARTQHAAHTCCIVQARRYTRNQGRTSCMRATGAQSSCASTHSSLPGPSPSSGCKVQGSTQCSPPGLFSSSVPCAQC